MAKFRISTRAAAPISTSSQDNRISFVYPTAMVVHNMRQCRGDRMEIPGRTHHRLLKDRLTRIRIAGSKFPMADKLMLK